MAKYRKKPVVIDAIQWTGENAWGIRDFIGGQVGWSIIGGESLSIDTLEGRMEASRGDWIIKGIKGEFYPIKNDIFEQTYEAVVDA